MAKPITINLFGKNGQRSLEIQPRGGFSTRHVKVPLEPVPSIFSPVTPEMVEAEKEAAALLKPPAPEKADLKCSLTSEAVLDVLRKMTHDDDRTIEKGWFILDEILFVATTKCGIRANHSTLLDTLRDLYRKEIVDHKTNRFNQHVFKIADNWEEAEWLSDLEAQQEYKEWCEELDAAARAEEDEKIDLHALLVEVDTILKRGNPNGENKRS